MSIKKLKKDLMPGDHIMVRRYGFLYTHHGIYIGGGKVIHYNGELFKGKSGAKIEKSSVEKFLEGARKVHIVNHKDALPASETLKRARSRLKESDYKILFNNCEHFATWCKTGRGKSSQVWRVLSTTAATVSALVAVVITKSSQKNR